MRNRARPVARIHYLSVGYTFRSRTPVRSKATWHQSGIIRMKRMSYGSLCIFLHKRNFSTHPSNFRDPLFRFPEFPLSLWTGFFPLLYGLYCYRANDGKRMQLVDGCGFSSRASVIFFAQLEKETSGIDERNCSPTGAFMTFDEIDVKTNDPRDFLSLSSI